MKLFLDTNVWLRYLVPENQVHHNQSKRLIEFIESGAIKAYSSTIVFLEVGFVLRSVYEVSKRQVLVDLETLLKLRKLQLIEKTDFRKAVELHKITAIKLVGCLIAGQLPHGVKLCSFDEEFKKVKSIELITPMEVLSLVNE